MQTAILTLHVVVCLVLIILVLLQAGREGMGVIFGGGNSSVFGSTGAGGMLVKLTAFLAVTFVVTSLSYNLLTSSSADKPSTILDVRFEDEAPVPPVQPTAPVEPATPAAETPAAATERTAPAEEVVPAAPATPVAEEAAPAEQSPVAGQ